MADIAKLKPCPFCGSTDLTVHTYDVQPDDYHGGYITCDECEAHGRSAITLDGWLGNKAEAEAASIEAWNTRALDAAQAGGWQPIESAPKDGTDLIGYRPDQGVFAFRWAWMEEFVPKDQNGDPTEDYDDSFACWWHDRWGWMERELTPTCWQPLPAPPTPIAQKEEAE